MLGGLYSRPPAAAAKRVQWSILSSGSYYRFIPSARARADLSGTGEPARIRYCPMHYPRRISNIKRVRKLGFRARMKTSKGRKLINRKRRMGRRVAAA